MEKNSNLCNFFNNTETYTETLESLWVPNFGFNKILPKLISNFDGAESGKFSRVSRGKKLMCKDVVDERAKSGIYEI
jgi:hypothetical protein